jgi:hypothetical protein
LKWKNRRKLGTTVNLSDNLESNSFKDNPQRIKQEIYNEVMKPKLLIEELKEGPRPFNNFMSFEEIL